MLIAVAAIADARNGLAFSVCPRVPYLLQVAHCLGCDRQARPRPDRKCVPGVSHGRDCARVGARGHGHGERPCLCRCSNAARQSAAAAATQRSTCTLCTSSGRSVPRRHAAGATLHRGVRWPTVVCLSSLLLWPSFALIETDAHGPERPLLRPTAPMTAAAFGVLCCIACCGLYDMWCMLQFWWLNEPVA